MTSPVASRKRSESRVRFEDEEDVHEGDGSWDGQCGERGLGLIKDSDRILPANIVGYRGVYIRNLSPQITYEQLQKTFSKFGDIADIKRKRKLVQLCYTFTARHAVAGTSKVYAFIHYDNTESPRRAIQAYHGLNDEELSAGDTRLTMRYAPGYNQERIIVTNKRYVCLDE